MTDLARPFLVIYVVWHPDFLDGSKCADAIRAHFRRSLFENVAGGAGVSVIFRSAAAPDGSVPASIDFEDAETTAIVALADNNMANDKHWVEYLQSLAKQTDSLGLGARLFPISIDRTALGMGLEEQAFRWDLWAGAKDERIVRLTTELTYEFCRMLRHYLEHLRRPSAPDEDLLGYLKKVQIF